MNKQDILNLQNAVNREFYDNLKKITAIQQAGIYSTHELCGREIGHEWTYSILTGNYCGICGFIKKEG